MPSDAPNAAAESPTWAELRDAAATAHLAVQMLAGPLAPWSDPAPDPQRVRETVRSLEEATRRVNTLVAALRPESAARAGGDGSARAPAPFVRMPELAQTVAPRTVPAPQAVVPARADMPPRAATPSPSPSQVRAAELPVAMRPQPRPGRERRKPPAAVLPPPVPSVEVGALLRAVEIELLTQGHSLSIHAPAGLWVEGDADGLLAPIVALVLDAAALGPIDARVELRAFTDLACALGDEVDVVFEIRPDIRVPPGRAFRQGATPPSLPEGVRIELSCAGARPRACLRAAVSAPARILAA